MREVTLTSQPNKRVVATDAIRDIVLCMCSPTADAITGTAPPVDGGSTAG